jgi:hypothetical protein
VGDGAEVLDQLLARHADAEVLDRDRLGRVVGGDVDLEVRPRRRSRFSVSWRCRSFSRASEAFETSFAHEDLFVGVERVDDDIEQLPDLGLELEVGEFLRG